MAKDIKRHVTHIKSKVVESGLPKLPAAADISEGEIAVNYAKGYETLSIKNESGDVVTFETKQLHYGTCDTAGATNKKIVTVDGPFVLRKGVMIAVKFTNSNTSASTNVTLNVNNTGDNGIYYGSSVYTSTGASVCGAANRVNTYVFDGTYWVWVSHGVDDNSTYTVVDNTYVKYKQSKAATVIYRYQLLVTKDEDTLLPINTVSNNTGTSKTLTTEEFDPFGGIYYYNVTATTDSGAVIATGRTYQEILANLSYSFNIGTSLTVNKMVYLVVSPQSNGKVKLHSSPISQTLPTTDDGLLYIALGTAYSNKQVQLEIPHPIYQFKDGQLRQYVGSFGTLSISGNNTSVATFSASQSGNTGLIITAGTNVSITPDATNHKITIAATNTDSATTLNGHYTPSSSATISKTASSTTNATWGSSDFVTGITLYKDAKGHITDMAVSSLQLPGNPNTDSATTLNGHYSPTATSANTKSASASSSTELAWGSAVVTGVTLSGDAKGHITSVTVSSGKLKTPTSYSAGTAAQLSAGTDTYNGLWSAENLKDGVAALGYTKNTGTVTKVATGAGLTGGDFTTSGTVKCALSSETKSTLSATSMGSTASRQYAVGLDKNGVLSVNIPWDNTRTVQASANTDGSFPVLIKNTNNNTAETAATKFATGVTINPSNNTISTTNLIVGGKGVGETIHYLTGTTGAAGGTNLSASWSGNCSEITDLYTGLCVQIKIPSAGHKSGVTLSINSTEKHPILYNDSKLTTHYPVNSVKTMVYDAEASSTYYSGSSTAVSIQGVWRCDADYDYDSNTDYYIGTNQIIYKTNAAAYRYMLLLQKDETTLTPVNTTSNTTAATKTLTTSEFDPFGDILYKSSTATTNANATIPTGVTWTQYALNLAYSFNTTNTLTAQEAVYIVAVPQSNGKAKLHSSPISQTLPTTDDGLIYIYLGQAYNTTNIYLLNNHPVYEFKNGALRQYTGPDSSPTIYSAVTINANQTNVTCPASITGSSKDGAQATVIYKNGGTSTVWTITVSNTSNYVTPDGNQLTLYCRKGGYTEINYLNIGGIIYVRGV